MSNTVHDPTELRGSAVLALGFATTVTMWAAAYACRLPAVSAPSWLLGLLLLAAVLGWGAVAGRLAPGGRVTALAVGGLAGLLNLLVLGGLLTSSSNGRMTDTALIWVPGSIALMAVLAGLGAVAAGRAAADRTSPDWTALFARVAVAATFLLIVAGGLVTSEEAGLAVVDWPNTFGYAMFLYPVSRMTGGIYFEHAHRLFGSLVGLTTVVLALHLWRVEARSWVKRLAAAAVVVVVAQGILGGLRVTGRFTMSTSAHDMVPNLSLAVAHGVLGQVFLAVMVVLAAASSRLWKTAGPAQTSAAAAMDRTLQPALVAVLLVQLVLGALQRHFAAGLIVHITLAAVVATVAVAVGVRAWALYPGVPLLARLGRALVIVVLLQVALGIAALAVTGGVATTGNPRVLDVTLTTAHQACGAILLATTVLLTAWTRRLAGAPSA